MEMIAFEVDDSVLKNTSYLKQRIKQKVKDYNQKNNTKFAVGQVVLSEQEGDLFISGKTKITIHLI